MQPQSARMLLYAGGGLDDRIEQMSEDSWRSCFRPRGMLLTLLAVGCVLGLTHIPGESIPRVLENVAPVKVEHIIGYSLMTGFFLFSLKRPVRMTLLVTGLAALALIGLLDETTQPLVHRSCDLGDYASDLTGITVACGIFWASRLWAARVPVS